MLSCGVRVPGSEIGQPADSACQVHKSISSIARESFQVEINHCLKSSSEQEEKEEREKYFPVENFFFFCHTGYYQKLFPSDVGIDFILET